MNPNSHLIQDGTTSINLDTKRLSLSGITLSGVDGTVEPISDEFAVGFDIIEESDFLFRKENGFTPISGEIKHTGTITLSSALLGDIVLGDFDVGFDPSRQSEDASGFFVKNTVDGLFDDLILFDISNTESLEISEMDISLGSADLLISEEFAKTLLDNGLAPINLKGFYLGDAMINADFIPSSAG